MDIFACHYCEYNSKWKFALEEHIKIHGYFFHCTTKLGNFHCFICHYKCTAFKKLLSHFNKYHKSELDWELNKNNAGATKTDCGFVCSICSFQTSYSRSLLLHLEAQHTDINQSFSCSFCTFQTTKPCYLIGHLKFKHKLGYSTKTQCKVCKKEINKSNLRAHVIYHHTLDTKVKWFSCDHCMYKAKFKRILDVHVRRKHIPKNSLEILKCPLCLEYETTCQENLTTHIRRQHENNSEEKLPRCLQCNYVSKSANPANLKWHILNYHTDADKKEWYNCSICSYKTLQKHHLKTHEERKHNVNKEKKLCFLCSHCSYRCMTAQYLNSHTLRHHTPDEEINWFKCNQCYFKAKTKQDLTKHTKIVHSEKKYFSCLHCKFKSLNEINLKKHESRRHNLDQSKISDVSGENNSLNICPYCEFSASAAIHLRNHIIRKHTPYNEIQWHYCSFCPYKAKLKDDLNKHFKRHHNDKNTS